MRVAFLTPAVPGHAYPMTTLARRLKGRGHDVVSIGFPDAEPLVRAAELPFVPFGEKEYPAGSFREKRGLVSRLQGQDAPRMRPELPTANGGTTYVSIFFR